MVNNFVNLPPFLTARFGALGPVCRLGLASRGGAGLAEADVLHAVAQGVNFLNWCGTADGLSRAVAGLGPRRREVKVCVQLEARTAADAGRELDRILTELRTDYVDVVTFYYVEEPQEWRQIAGPGGALAFCQSAKDAGRIRLVGVTSHQRRLAAEMAQTGLLDMLMIRYNAAHRGAEAEVFPHTDRLGLPVVAYTALRWGALPRTTPDDPPAFVPPPAPAWYRFVLQSPSVTVALAAPESRAELEADLTVLDARGPLAEDEFQRLAEHGQRVRRHGGAFP
jgi:predicted aldo/keto reductase-like oxidoreductase